MTNSGMRRASSISPTHLANSVRARRYSTSWKASRSGGRALNLADEQDHRHGILPGHMQAGGGVGGAGAAGDHANARLAGQSAPAIGHHRRAAFLAAHHHVDLGVMERIQHSQIALARHAGEALHAIGDERLYDQLAAGLLGHRAHSSSASREAEKARATPSMVVALLLGQDALLIAALNDFDNDQSHEHKVNVDFAMGSIA